MAPPEAERSGWAVDQRELHAVSGIQPRPKLMVDEGDGSARFVVAVWVKIGGGPTSMLSSPTTGTGSLGSTTTSASGGAASTDLVSGGGLNGL